MTKLYEKKVTPNSLENGLNIEESYSTIDTGVKIDFTEFNDFLIPSKMMSPYKNMIMILVS